MIAKTDVSLDLHSFHMGRRASNRGLKALQSIKQEAYRYFADFRGRNEGNLNSIFVVLVLIGLCSYGQGVSTFIGGLNLCLERRRYFCTIGGLNMLKRERYHISTGLVPRHHYLIHSLALSWQQGTL